MKVFGCLLMAAAILVVHTRGNLLFHNGKEYVFQTEVSGSSGTMDYATHTSGFSYKYHTRIQASDNKLNVKIEDLKFSQFVGAIDVADHPFDHTLFTDINQDIPPFSVEFDGDGLFSKLVYSSGLTTFEKNVVKAWAQMLQINEKKLSDEHNHGFISHEKMLNGDCDVTYTVSHDRIFKSVTYDSDCDHRIHKMTQNWGGHRCDIDEAGKTESVDGLHSTGNMAYAVEKNNNIYNIKAIISSGSTIAQMYQEEGISYIIYTNVTSILTEVKDSSNDIKASGETTDSLRFEWSDTEYQWNKDRDLKAAEPFFSTGKYFDDDMNNIKQGVIKGLTQLFKVMSELSHSKDSVQQAHQHGINTILPAMYALDYDTLSSLFDELIADKSEDGVQKSNVFNELLGMTGTSASALLIRDLVMENKFDNVRDTIRVLTSVPFHIRRSNAQLVHEYEKLLAVEGKQILKDHIPLVLGHLVRSTCERSEEPKECFKNLAVEYVDKYVQKIFSAETHEEKILAVTVLYNIRHGGIAEKLKPLIYGETEIKCPNIRNQAIWAVSHELAHSQAGIDYYLPIFADHEFSTQCRIGAITNVFFSNPTASTFNTILAVLYTETDYEVVNYVFTLMEKYANSMSICNKHTGDLSRYYLKYLKQWSKLESQWGFGISKTYTREFEQKKYGYGGSLTYSVVGSERSTMPLFIHVSIERSLFKTAHGDIVSVGLKLQGLSKHIVKKIKNVDPSIWKLDDLKSILNTDMNIRAREDESVQVEIFVSIKGSIVFLRQYDEDSIKPGGNLNSFMETLKGIEDTYTINHQRIFQLGSLMFEEPTAIGVPVSYMNSLTALISFKATVKKGNHRGLLFRDVNYDLTKFTQGSHIMMIRNPAQKQSYAITQNRVYYTHFPRKFVAGVNLVKKELKLNIHRPTVEEPSVIIMHSQSEVVVRSDTLIGTSDITEHCPTCTNSRVLISKGPDAVKSRVFIDIENEVRGVWMHGEFFDCEYGMDRGRTISHGLQAFMPYNKNPKTLYNSLLLGYFQIRAFLLHYPRTEKCGMMIRRSQSKTNPVKEVEFSLRANAEPNGERIFFRGRKIFIKMLIKSKGSPSDRLYKVNFSYEYTPAYLKNNLKIQFQRAAIPNFIDDFSVCFNMENEYPEMNKDFMNYDEDMQMEVNGKARLRYGKVSDCTDAEGEMKLSFKHSTTEESRHDLTSRYYYKKCMEQKNTAGWSNRGDRLPLTEDCYLTVWDATTARKYDWDLEFVKLTDRMSAIVSQVQSVLKVGLLPYWDIDPETVSAGSSEPHMKIDAEFKNFDKNLDLYIETSQGGQHFNDIPLNLNWYSRLRNLKFTKMFKRLLDYGIINPCVVTSENVQTMDNVTYPYTPSSCWTLTSAHCSPEPTFAVFTKKSSNLPLAVKAYFGGHTVEFQPQGPKTIDVIIDGSKLDVTDKEHIHTESGQEIFKIFKWGSVYNVYSFMKVWITYDGHFVQIIPAPSTKGQHCGICGNYNRNHKDEFTGKNGNVLSSAAELVEDYKWKC